MRASISSLSPWLALLARAVPSAAADCTREALLAAAEQYVAAQQRGDLNLTALPAAAKLAYRENNVDMDIKAGVLSKPLNVSYHRSTADTEACASYTELVAPGGPTPYVIATQITHSRAAGDMAAALLIDTVAATTGALRFDAAKTLEYFRAEDWSPLAPARRPSRAALRAAADAYLDMWTNASAIDTIPWGTPCQRVEGSARVSPCTAGAPRGGSSKPITMRRFVIDEVVGSADVMCSFTAVGDIPDSHELRIEDGKVRYVHTITLSAKKPAAAGSP